MLNPILTFSVTRRMRSFRTMVIVMAWELILLAAALAVLGGFFADEYHLDDLEREPVGYALLVAAQFALLVLIAPTMTSGAIAGERERQTLDLLLVTDTGPLRLAWGKILESFALLALLIACAMPVQCLCLLIGGVTLPQILTGTMFLLAVALACAAVGVFSSALFSSTVVSGVMSYLILLTIGVITTLPFFLGYPRAITNVVYDPIRYGALTPAGARGMLPWLFYLNPGFGLLCLIQGQIHPFTELFTQRGWGRILCTWRMMERAGCETIALICAGALLVLSAALTVGAAVLIRRRTGVRRH